MEDLVPIGRFAEATRLSLRALRLYDENGLLPPARVDADSGYRYYRPEQARRATLIRLLRRAGMPLSDIRLFLADPRHERLTEYEAALVDELADRRRVLRYLRKLLKEEPMFDVRTKHVAELRYVGRTTRTTVDGLEPFIVKTIEELWPSVEPTDHAFTVYHGPVNEQDDGPVEVCVPTAAGDRVLPAAEVAYTEATGAECEFPEILGAYDAVWSWAKASGREPEGPPREIYRSDPAAGEEARIEIAWPLK
jgi:DNA-binding transcriptional MerR regulator